MEIQVNDQSKNFDDFDQAFKFYWGFEDSKEFLLNIMETDGTKIDLSSGIILIELPEGVFVRTTNYRVCEVLLVLERNSRETAPKIIENIDIPEWNLLTNKTRQPINEWGDKKLVWWKVGF